MFINFATQGTTQLEIIQYNSIVNYFILLTFKLILENDKHSKLTELNCYL